MTSKHSRQTLSSFSGLSMMIRKEIRQWLEGSLLWILFAVILIFAISGPFTARYMGELMSALVDPATAELLSSQIADPTWIDSYAQWTKNLVQIVALMVILISGGAISSEINSGSASLILTRCVGRSAFVTAKVLTNSAIVLVATLIGMVVTWALTLSLFGEASFVVLAESTLTWWVATVFLLTLTVFASAWIGNSAGAAAVGIGGYALLNLAGIWAPARKYSPGGILSLSSSLPAGSIAVEEIWFPIVTTLAAAVLMWWLLCKVFGRREI